MIWGGGTIKKRVVSGVDIATGSKRGRIGSGHCNWTGHCNGVEMGSYREWTPLYDHVMAYLKISFLLLLLLIFLKSEMSSTHCFLRTENRSICH